MFHFRNLINGMYVKSVLGNLPSCVFGHIILEGQITAIEYQYNVVTCIIESKRYVNVINAVYISF